MQHGERRRVEEACRILASSIATFRADADPKLLDRLDSAVLVLEDLSRRTRSDRAISTAFALLAEAVAG